MGQLVPFETSDGATVLVEVGAASPDAGPVMRGGGRAAVIADRARQTFEEAIGHIEPAVHGLVERMSSLAESPDEVHIEFGVNLHAEAGAFIAAAGTTANFSVTLTWHRGSGPAAEPAGNAPAPAESS